MAIAARATAPDVDSGPSVPGGADARPYVWAVQSFVVLFLLVVCIGLLNFLGMSFKKWSPPATKATSFVQQSAFPI